MVKPKQTNCSVCGSEFKRGPTGKAYCTDCHTKHQIKYRKNNPTRQTRYHIERKYDITIEEYTCKLIAQNYVCAICGKKEEIENRSLSVDHCHITGKVRGLLCNKCNTAIGMLHDDIALVSNALSYLIDYKGK